MIAAAEVVSGTDVVRLDAAGGDVARVDVAGVDVDADVDADVDGLAVDGTVVDELCVAGLDVDETVVDGTVVDETVVGGLDVDGLGMATAGRVAAGCEVVGPDVVMLDPDLGCVGCVGGDGVNAGDVVDGLGVVVLDVDVGGDGVNAGGRGAGGGAVAAWSDPPGPSTANSTLDRAASPRWSMPPCATVGRSLDGADRAPGGRTYALVLGLVWPPGSALPTRACRAATLASRRLRMTASFNVDIGRFRRDIDRGSETRRSRSAGVRFVDGRGRTRRAGARLLPGQHPCGDVGDGGGPRRLRCKRDRRLELASGRGVLNDHAGRPHGHVDFRREVGEAGRRLADQPPEANGVGGGDRSCDRSIRRRDERVSRPIEALQHRRRAIGRC